MGTSESDLAAGGCPEILKSNREYLHTCNMVPTHLRELPIDPCHR